MTVTAEPAPVTHKQKRIGYIITAGVVVVALSIGANLYSSWSAWNSAKSTHALVQAIRKEQQSNTSRVQAAAQTESLVKAVEHTLTHNHLAAYPLLVNICHSLPGCTVPAKGP